MSMWITARMRIIPMMAIAMMIMTTAITDGAAAADFTWNYDRTPPSYKFDPPGYWRDVRKTLANAPCIDHLESPLCAIHRVALERYLGDREGCMAAMHPSRREEYQDYCRKNGEQAPGHRLDPDYIYQYRIISIHFMTEKDLLPNWRDIIHDRPDGGVVINSLPNDLYVRVIVRMKCRDRKRCPIDYFPITASEQYRLHEGRWLLLYNVAEDPYED